MSDLFTEVEQAERVEKRAALASDPSIITNALPRYMDIIRRFDALMRANRVDEACELEAEADALAIELQGEQMGILAPDGAGTMLEQAAAAAPGTVPMWGQMGTFEASLSIYKIRFHIRGLFGIGSPFAFDIHAVEFDRPFFSETGYRSFAGYMLASVPEGCTVDLALVNAVREWSNAELKGKLKHIAPQYRPASDGERFYVIECGTGKALGDLAGYVTENHAQGVAAVARAKSSAPIRHVGPYTREAFLSMLAHDGWKLEGERVVPAVPDRSPLEYCKGCGDPVACCSCGKCEECGELLEHCECDETEPDDFGLVVDPVEVCEDLGITPTTTTKPEQLSLF